VGLWHGQFDIWPMPHKLSNAWIVFCCEMCSAKKIKKEIKS